MSKAGPRESAVPASIFDALRSELKSAAGTLQMVRALHHVGYDAGIAAASTFEQEAGGSATSLGQRGFWARLSTFFSARGWGTMEHRNAHPGVGMLGARDWAEADPENPAPEAGCSFSAGFLSGLLTELAGGPIAVLEVSCRSRGDATCDFAFGSETAIHDLYGRLLDGAELETALAEL